MAQSGHRACALQMSAIGGKVDIATTRGAAFNRKDADGARKSRLECQGALPEQAPKANAASQKNAEIQIFLIAAS